MTLGGEGQFGRIFSEESRRKMSESAKKRCTDKFRKEKSMLMNKLRENKSFVKKQCAASKIALLNPEVQKKLGIGRRGRPFSKEHRRKIGQAVSGERNGMYSRKILV